MAIELRGSGTRDAEVLFRSGTAAGLSEGELLDRFISRRDEAPFAAIVARHGPMVLGVCRRWLRRSHDVEDAFQATFLVLVRQSRVLRDPERMGPWLHGVAWRVAARARQRLEREVPAELDSAAGRGHETDRQELAAIVDEEIGRLPERYRLPVVLCHLEGLTQDQAAQQLRWKPGALRGRLTRARSLLRKRLIRRGLAPAAVGAWVAEGEVAQGAVSPALLESTVAAAQLIAGGGAVASRVLVLVEGVQAMILLSRLKTVAAVAALTGVFSLGAFAVAYQESGAGKDPQEPKPAVKVDAPPPKAVTERDRAARDQAIESKLDLVVPFDVPAEGIPLRDFLKSIKKATKGPDDNGIPIYVNPVGLRGRATIETKVEVPREKVPVRYALRTALDPFDLSFTVKDGLLVVDSRIAIIESRVEDVERKLDRVLKALEKNER